jgi:hypothetical protein
MFTLIWMIKINMIWYYKRKIIQTDKLIIRQASKIKMKIWMKFKTLLVALKLTQINIIKK